MLRRAIVALMVVAGLLFGSGMVLAEDSGKPAGDQDSSGAAATTGARGAATAEADETDSAVVDDAIRDVPTNAPTYRGDLLYPRFSDESPHEAFMRLAEDFLYMSEIGGYQGLGRVPLWPRGSIKAGPFRIFPYLVGSISWTDNAYEDERKASSWYWTAGGGFTGQANFAGGRGSVGFGLDYRYEDYLQQSDLSFSEWIASFHVGYVFPVGFWFKAGVKYEDLSRPVGSDYTGISPRQNFLPFVDFGFANAFGNKINIDFGIKYQNNNFDRDAYETGNVDATTVWVKVSYPFIKDTTRIYIRYSYSWDNRGSDFQNNLNNGNELVGGIEGAIPIGQTDKLLGFLELGYQNASFADAYVVQRGIVTDDDSENGTAVIRARLRYRMGPRTSMDASVVKDMTFSTLGNYQDRWYADYNATYNLARDLVLRGTALFEWTKASGDGTTVTRFGFGVGARYLLTENMDLFTDMNWNRRNTIRPGWDTDWFTATFGMTLYLQ